MVGGKVLLQFAAPDLYAFQTDAKHHVVLMPLNPNLVVHLTLTHILKIVARDLLATMAGKCVRPMIQNNAVITAKKRSNAVLNGVKNLSAAMD